MSRSSLFHKFRKDTRTIGSLPLRRHMSKNLVTDRPFLPVWDQNFFLIIIVFFLYRKMNQFPVIHHMKIFHCMAAQIRECGSCLGAVSLFSHNQFPFPDIQGLLCKIIFQSHGTKFRDTDFALIFLISLRKISGTLHIHMCLRIQTFFPQSLNPLIHSTSAHYFSFLPNMRSHPPISTG